MILNSHYLPVFVTYISVFKPLNLMRLFKCNYHVDSNVPFYFYINKSHVVIVMLHLASMKSDTEICHHNFTHIKIRFSKNNYLACRHSYLTYNYLACWKNFLHVDFIYLTCRGAEICHYDMFLNCHYKYPACTIMRIALNYKQNRKPSNEPFDSTKFVKAGIVYIRVYIRCILIHRGIDVSF